MKLSVQTTMCLQDGQSEHRHKNSDVTGVGEILNRRGGKPDGTITPEGVVVPLSGNSHRSNDVHQEFLWTPELCNDGGQALQ